MPHSLLDGTQTPPQRDKEVANLPFILHAQHDRSAATCAEGTVRVDAGMLGARLHGWRRSLTGVVPKSDGCKG